MADIFLKGLRPYLWVIFICFFLYSRAASFGLSFLDDNILILENQKFLNGLPNILEAFKQDVFHALREYDAAYRPILTISFIIDAQLDRLLGLGYHFSNIVFHATASCLVLLFFLRLKYNRSLAFLFSLIFAVHPVLTQAVAWIPGRNDSLLGIFVLTSFISLLRFLERDRWVYLGLHLAFFILAIFTKEAALALLPVSVFYCIAFERRRLFLRNKIKMISGWFLAIALWYVLRANALSDSPIALSFLSVLRDIVHGFPAILSYLGKALFPVNLSIIPTIKDTTVIYGTISALVLIAGLSISGKKRYSFIAFGLVWYLSFLLITFIRPVSDQSSIFLESRMYLPILGIFMILGEMDVLKDIDLSDIRSFICISVIVSLFFYASFAHEANFKDAAVFWECAAKRSPNSSLAQHNLGWVYNMQGRSSEAESQYMRALEINPRQRYAHNSLGSIYEVRGQLDKAEAEYLAEVENTPYYLKAYSNLARLYYIQNKPEKAAEILGKSLRINGRRHNAQHPQNP